MTDVKLLPDMETLVCGWLRDHTAIAALDARVATRRPRTMSRPWVLVTQLNARDYERARLEHLVRYLFQFDTYAGEDAMAAHLGWKTACDLKRTVRGALYSWRATTMDGVAVSSVAFLDDRPLNDTDFEPPMDRYVLTAQITAHAV